MSNCFNENSAFYVVGGFAMLDGKLTLSDCNLGQNMAGGGSAGYICGGSLIVVRSRVESNRDSLCNLGQT